MKSERLNKVFFSILNSEQKRSKRYSKHYKTSHEETRTTDGTLRWHFQSTAARERERERAGKSVKPATSKISFQSESRPDRRKLSPSRVGLAWSGLVWSGLVWSGLSICYSAIIIFFRHVYYLLTSREMSPLRCFFFRGFRKGKKVSSLKTRSPLSHIWLLLLLLLLLSSSLFVRNGIALPTSSWVINASFFFFFFFQRAAKEKAKRRSDEIKLQYRNKILLKASQCCQQLAGPNFFAWKARFE